MGMSFVGSYYGAKSQKANLELQADLADINARMSETAAQNELARGQREYASYGLKQGAFKSRQITSMAANGIDMANSTTANAVLSTTDYIAESDGQEILSNALKAAFGHKTQAANFRSDAAMRRASAGGIRPGMTAFGELARGGASLASNYYSLNKAGAFDKPASPSAGSTGVSGTGFRPRANTAGLFYSVD